MNCEFSLISKIPRAQIYSLLIVAGALLLAQINQPYPQIAPLQHGPLVVVLAGSPWLVRRWPISNSALFCLSGFALLHIIGGRYAYSNVPYDNVLLAHLGWSISENFEWTRNHYNRLVHFSFGALLVWPVADWLFRHRAIKYSIGAVLGLGLVLAASCLYEIFEWMLTLIAEGATADDYNGQQGDIWDAQKDMALASLGALLAGLLLWSKVKR